MSQTMIDAKKVAFSYTTEEELPREVLHGVSLKVEKGSFVALLGHNGSGKSTMAKMFNALLLPSGGQVLVEEMDTADEERKYDIRRTVGMVLQNPDNQLVSTVVEEDVAFGPENLGVPPAEIRERVEAALRAVICGSSVPTHRINSRADKSNGWLSRVCWQCNRAAWCWMSPPRCWTRKGAAK